MLLDPGSALGSPALSCVTAAVSFSYHLCLQRPSGIQCRARPGCALLPFPAPLPPSSYFVSAPSPFHPTPLLPAPSSFLLTSLLPCTPSQLGPLPRLLLLLCFASYSPSALPLFTSLLSFICFTPPAAAEPLLPPLSCGSPSSVVPSPCYVPLSCFPPASCSPALGLWLSHAVAMESPKAAGRLSLAALRPREQNGDSSQDCGAATLRGPGTKRAPPCPAPPLEFSLRPSGAPGPEA